MKKIQIGSWAVLALALLSSCTYRGLNSDSSTNGQQTGENTFSSDITDEEKELLAQVSSGDFTKIANYSVGDLNAKFEVRKSSVLTDVVYRADVSENVPGGSVSFDIYIAVDAEEFVINNYAFDGSLTTHGQDDAFKDDALNLIGTSGEGTAIAGSTITSDAIISACQAAISQAKIELGSNVDNTFSSDISENEKTYLAQVASGSFTKITDFQSDELDAKYEVHNGNTLTALIYRGSAAFTEIAGSTQIDMAFDLYVAVSPTSLTILDYAFDGKIASSDATLDKFLNDGLGLVGTDGDVDIITGSTHTSEKLIELCKAAVKQAKEDINSNQTSSFTLQFDHSEYKFVNELDNPAEPLLLTLSILDKDGNAYSADDLDELKNKVVWDSDDDNLITIRNSSLSTDGANNEIQVYLVPSASLTGSAIVSASIDDQTVSLQVVIENKTPSLIDDITDMTISEINERIDSREELNDKLYRTSGTIDFIWGADRITLKDAEGNELDVIGLASHYEEGLFTLTAESKLWFVNPENSEELFYSSDNPDGIKEGDEISLVGICDSFGFKGYYERTINKA